jgi:hypothetical protein
MFKRTPTLITAVTAVLAAMLAAGALATSASADPQPGYVQLPNQRITLSYNTQVTGSKGFVRVYDDRAVDSYGRLGVLKLVFNYHLDILHSRTLYVDNGDVTWWRNSDGPGQTVPFAPGELSLNTDYWNTATEASGELPVYFNHDLKVGLNLSRLSING